MPAVPRLGRRAVPEPSYPHPSGLPVRPGFLGAGGPGRRTSRGRGVIVGLWGREQLAEDSGVQDGGGWGGITLAHNVRSPAEVDTVIAEAEAAGATIPRHGAETFWGGYSGVFVDPDGHPWEVAHNPHWTIEDDGSVRI